MKINNSVNRIIGGVFWILGWAASYYLVYDYSSTKAAQEVVNGMYYYCTTATPISFGSPDEKYVCARVYNL